jgi:hypothetical protein
MVCTNVVHENSLGLTLHVNVNPIKKLFTLHVNVKVETNTLIWFYVTI